ncbi:GMC family oxidoreductase [Natrinema salaciae]|uniref:Choline dehydrogenase n=1 Tax=Natrinema salaciae TaxID=1186196 RepID=A0A1H9P7N4_9EURY|nr:GMC family oxidoreductase N-terminal domain-containing protein [Natrinema salaciae]SER43583.1 choline dehydrogenase [Natrinema salaciae]
MALNDSAYDFVLVGAGSAGCALAHRLSADPDADVLLLEAGHPDEKEEIHVPALFPSLFKTEYDWDYHTAPQSELNDRVIYVPRGKMLGGSSSINAMIYIRGNAYDYDTWADLGNEGWGYDEMLEYFKRSEHFEPGDSEYHGQGGPLNVADPADPHPVSSQLVEAAVEVGHVRNDDFSGEQQQGVGHYHVTQKDGQRCSAAKAFITPILDRDNLTAETGAQVTEIRFEGDRAVGVTYEQDGTTHEADAAQEVIVSAGSINSPQLLMLSGIGPADHLAEHGIEVQTDLPGVGRNLQDHLFSFVIHERTAGPDEPAPSSNIGEAGGFTYVDDDAPAPDLQYHFAPVYFMENGLGNPDEGVGFSVGATQVRPESRGRITLASADPFEDPVLDPKFLTEDTDWEIMVEGVKRAREIARADAMDEYRGPEVWPGEDVTTDEGIREHIRETAHTVYHPVGTCKMGDDDMAVVDDSLQVHGVENLRVVDASIMPTLTSGNTNAPTIAIAEKAADMIKSEVATPADD